MMITKVKGFALSFHRRLMFKTLLLTLSLNVLYPTLEYKREVFNASILYEM